MKLERPYSNSSGLIFQWQPWQHKRIRNRAADPHRTAGHQCSFAVQIHILYVRKEPRSRASHRQETDFTQAHLIGSVSFNFALLKDGIVFLAPVVVI